MTRPSVFLRLEPSRPAGSPQRGFAAELADPAWMVGRQWQLGEHQGENASSPLEVVVGVRHVPVAAMAGREHLDPSKVPAEAIVEAGTDDWWTRGRRLRLGRAAARAGLATTASLFTDLTGPYASLNGRAHDGRRIYRDQPGHPVFADVPESGPDCWQPETMVYAAELECDGATLHVGGLEQPASRNWVGHDGGDLDWWAVDAAGPVGGWAPDRFSGRFPTRFRWPGAPVDRWWQIEDHLVDIGGLAPDRSHVASLFLLDLLLSHGDDWFLFPMTSSPGHVLCLDHLMVRDAFNETWELPLLPEPDDGWRLFSVSGLDPGQLLLFPSAADALVGDPIDVVTVGMDEDANLVWAVEEVLDGVATLRHRPSAPVVVVEGDGVRPGSGPSFRYHVATDVPDHWHPYVPEESAGAMAFRQGRLAGVKPDGSFDIAARKPPTAGFLTRPSGLHAIAPWRLPPDGVKLVSRPVLARSVQGAPVLWVQRRRQPLLSVPSSQLRFDAALPN